MSLLVLSLLLHIWLRCEQYFPQQITPIVCKQDTNFGTHLHDFLEHISLPTEIPFSTVV